MMAEPDRAKAKRASDAMMKIVKIDIDVLQAAFAGTTGGREPSALMPESAGSNLPKTDDSTWPRSTLVNVRFSQARQAATGVRRDKAALFQWVQAPSGNRSSRKQPEQS